MIFLKRKKGDTISLAVHIQPNSSRNQINGIHGDRLKIRITARPVDGKANAALIAFVAELFSTPKSAVSINSGHNSRAKNLLINGVSLDNARGIIQQRISS